MEWIAAHKGPDCDAAHESDEREKRSRTPAVSGASLRLHEEWIALSNTKTTPGNCVTKCVHMPRRVPGSAHADSRLSRTGGRVTVEERGASRSTIHTRTLTTAPMPAAAAKLDVHPYARTAPMSGTAATTAPSCPMMAVICSINGLRREENHIAMRRSTLMNVSASPLPSSMRASRAVGRSSAKAKMNWPTDMSAAPATSDGVSPADRAAFPPAPAGLRRWRVAPTTAVQAPLR